MSKSRIESVQESAIRMKIEREIADYIQERKHTVGISIAACDVSHVEDLEWLRGRYSAFQVIEEIIRAGSYTSP